MSDGILLLFLRQIFPEWSIMRGADGVWRAGGHVLIWASSVDGLMDALAAAVPDAAERVRCFFSDGS
ncbi:hypothetical protein E1293_36515 [Actinomadura darangshiensis]|uniref:Uncharacterized protein n=1 Tax=Actinomadura darangshiensis TaxID=705336 RepID=A0A4R5ACB0_9ACTN|nr:hypothetical protein [Actinomadura darangshiensis]TDD68860.1 hypothetical protein E1293_36515 [Actinomadura darangshiensis]